ncbi:MAG: hypothetical protein CTY37_00725 [Methylotenera sp.]|nr:MAG: hypothetical protein CTY37_00725 [Methylotenera sp.]
MHKQSIIHYRIRWKPAGNQSGAVRGLSAGIGDQLRALVLLRDHPDPRRLDLRASLRDPFERLWVRDFYLNTSLKVIVLLDASASMGYIGEVNRMQVAEDIATQLAFAAYRSSDAFGFYAANQLLIKHAALPPRLNRSAWQWVKQHVSTMQPQGNNADGLLIAAAQLPKRRSLVFVISDFRWVDGKLKNLLKGLSHHDVVPIMLQDPAEINQLPHRGIATLQDAETGESRFVWMRPSLVKKIEQARSQHVKTVQAASRAYGCKPFLVRGQFDSAKLTQYFMERHA